MPIYMSLEGVDGIVQSRSAPAADAQAGEFPWQVSLRRGSFDDPGVIDFGFGDGSVRHVEMQDDGPFHAYGDGFLSGVPEARAGGLIRLEIIYAPLGEPEPVGDLAVADVEAKGFVMHVGILL